MSNSNTDIPKNIDLSKITISEDVKRLIPPSFAKKHAIIPVSKVLVDEDEEIYDLIVAFRNFEGDSNDERLLSIVDTLEAVEDTTNMHVRPVFADSVDSFDVLMRRLYPQNKNQGVVIGSEAVFRDILNLALIQRASDIHLDAREEGGNLSFRVDGKQRQIRTLKPQEYTELVAIIKLQADLDIAERRTPLDGAISIDMGIESIDLRVATIPTLFGEHITLRILSTNMGSDLKEIDSLCFSDDNLKMLKEVLELPSGIVVVSGPTGSGKTTTLYAALRYLRDLGGRHIISLEDPVEMPLSGVTQVKIDSDNERVTFNKALRSVLRHDPDVVLIGEIRDEETADIAVRAALTGHLVLSTLHTNDSVGVITRLLDLGVADYLLASTLKLAMAQRLVRRPTPQSLKYEEATKDECRYMGVDPENAPKIPRAVSSEFDGGTGYSGRVAIYEMALMDDNFREMISNKATEIQMHNYIFNECGFSTLKKDGIDKTLSAMTTLAEVQAVAGYK